MAETFQEIIIDLGSTFTKIGIPDDRPQYIFPTVVGGPKNANGSSQRVFVGDEALSKVGIQELEYPITRGLISNWNLAEKILSHALHNELRCDPSETGLMFIEHPATPSNTREKLAEYLFGELELAAVCFVNPATSAIAALGWGTGVVLCSGGQTTYSMAVKDGKGILSSLVTLDIGRQDILDSFAKSLANDGLGSHQPRNTLNSIIDKHGYIPLDYDSEMQKNIDEVDVQFVLGDGQIQHFHHDIFKHNEIIFKPELYGLERDGIHKMIHTTIQKCDTSIHSELYSNIILAGGNASLPGIVPRLTNELKLLAPKYSNIIRFRKDTPECRSTCLFEGASYLSAQPFWRNHLWITRYDYFESGIGNLIEKTNPLGLN